MEKAEGSRKRENDDEGVKKLPQPGEEEETSAPEVPVSPPMREDDSLGRYVYEIGENLTSRYKIQSKIGQGCSCEVLECWDREEQESVAIKVSTSKRSTDNIEHEIYMLQKIAENSEARSRCVQIRRWFEYRKHTCIVFEILGPTLRQFLKKNNSTPVPLKFVREFGRQLLEAVVHLHDMTITHTDLKPENILLVSPDFVELPALEIYDVVQRSSSDDHLFLYRPKSSDVKLIDFGGSIFDHHRMQNENNKLIVTTRNYRAPEIILRLGWSNPCDLWSVGCILAELCTGQILFGAYHELDLEHLAMMERVLGRRLPEHMAQGASGGAEKYFGTGSILNWPEGASSADTVTAVNKHERLEAFVSRYVRNSQSSELIDLLNGLLRYDPSERLTARQALEHQFFTNLP